jgi:hypothetical protein
MTKLMNTLKEHLENVPPGDVHEANGLEEFLTNEKDYDHG